MAPPAAAKDGYHHGDLRNALVAAAAELARVGGPDAIAVRAAARAVGVTPTAAYRHFAGHEELAIEAKHYALGKLGEAMRGYIEAVPDSDDPLRDALTRTAAAGRAYISFALAEPGLFRTGFSQGGAIGTPKGDDQSHRPGAGTFKLLGATIDGLVTAGYTPEDRRPMADIAAWSATHGLSMLMLEGPLQGAPEQVRAEAITRTLTVLLRGVGPGDPDLEPELAAAVDTAMRLAPGPLGPQVVADHGGPEPVEVGGDHPAA